MAPIGNFDCCVDAFFTKHQRAAKRATTLAKDRAAFRARTDAKTTPSHGGKTSSLKDSYFRHRAARAAARNVIASGNVESAADMPTISTGLLGNHKKRWSRKASICGMLQQSSATQDSSYDAFPTLQALCSMLEPDDMQTVTQSHCSHRLLAGETTVGQTISQEFKGFHAVDTSTESSTAAFIEDREDAAVFLDLPSPKAALESISKLEKDGFEKENRDGWVFISSHSSADAPVRAGSRRSSRRVSSRGRTIQTGSVVPSADACVDWSFAGIPRELCKRLIQGSRNTAHLSMHAKKEVPSRMPLSALRAQSKDRRERQGSDPCRSRSASKSRDCKQTCRRRL